MYFGLHQTIFSAGEKGRGGPFDFQKRLCRGFIGMHELKVMWNSVCRRERSWMRCSGENGWVQPLFPGSEGLLILEGIYGAGQCLRKCWPGRQKVLGLKLGLFWEWNLPCKCQIWHTFPESFNLCFLLSFNFCRQVYIEAATAGLPPTEVTWPPCKWDSPPVHEAWLLQYLLVEELYSKKRRKNKRKRKKQEKYFFIPHYVLWICIFFPLNFCL